MRKIKKRKQKEIDEKLQIALTLEKQKWWLNLTIGNLAALNLLQ